MRKIYIGEKNRMKRGWKKYYITEVWHSLGAMSFGEVDDINLKAHRKKIHKIIEFCLLGPPSAHDFKFLEV